MVSRGEAWYEFPIVVVMEAPWARVQVGVWLIGGVKSVWRYVMASKKAVSEVVTVDA